MRSCSVLLALLLAGLAAAQQKPRVKPPAAGSADDAARRLATVEMFAFGGVGYAGTTSQGEIEFKSVLAQPQSVALAAFEKLYATGNPQGKSYALAGIRKLRPSRFRELLASAEKSTDEVEVARGCIISHEPLGSVAKQIERGEFRF